VLLALGVSALLPGVVGFMRGGHARSTLAECRTTGLKLAGQGRWTLPGMLVTWGQNTGYAYIAAGLLGSAAVGELSAARLFIVPLNILMSAWGKIFVPRAGALLAGGQRAAVIAQCRRNALGVLGAALAYSAGIALLFALGGARWLPAGYARVGPLVGGWCAFGVISLERYVATQALLAHGAFRTLLRCALASAVVTIAAVAVLIPVLGALGALVGLSVGELVLGILAWTRLVAKAAPTDALERERDHAAAPAPAAATDTAPAASSRE
jgi:O-antigen/teichoic acid export membrane protein